MKSVIGVYETHDKAILALQQLQQAGYQTGQLSIIGKAVLVDKHLYVHANDNVEIAELSIGAVAGGILGVLTGVGVFMIPGFGLLYGAGAILGALTGVWGGFVTGGLVAILTTNVGIDEARAIRYSEHLKDGKFLVLVQGDAQQIKRAHEVLHTRGLSIELDSN